MPRVFPFPLPSLVSLGVKHLRHDQPRYGTKTDLEESNEGHHPQHGHDVRKEAYQSQGYHHRRDQHAADAAQHQRHAPRRVHELKGDVGGDHVDCAYQGCTQERVVDDSHKEAVRVVEDGIYASELLCGVEDHKRYYKEALLQGSQGEGAEGRGDGQTGVKSQKCTFLVSILCCELRSYNTSRYVSIKSNLKEMQDCMNVLLSFVLDF